MTLMDWLTLVNILLLLINIAGLLYQFFPKIYAYPYAYLCDDNSGIKCCISISNNSLLGIYLDSIDYTYRDGVHFENLKLTNFRLQSNCDYDLVLDECNCSAKIRLKHLCLINGRLRRSIVLNLYNFECNIKTSSQLSNHIILSKR